MPETESAETALLIYDGDCAFCLWWARYWQRGSAGRLRIAPYQQVANDYPHIAVQEFSRAAQYIGAEGGRSSAAEASLRAASAARGKGIWLSAYRLVPGFASLAERIYALIARHRSVFYAITLALWGRQPEPPRFDLVCELFLRALGLSYVAAFASFAVQALGLIGSDGILPVGDHLARIAARYGAAAYLRYPTVFWLNASDFALQAVSWGGAAIALLLVFDARPGAGWRRPLLLLMLFALYLSLFHAGQVFMIYQWDLLLLETGFLALFLPSGSVLAVCLLRWLLFRFMFLSGVVKLASGDASWADLTVLTRYFETQPLPTPLAWYAHQLPDTVLIAAAGAMFAIELVLPFFIFLPRRPRFLAAWSFIAFQLAIIATGNYGFFNLLTIALCLLLFDDQAIGKWLPRKWRGARTKRTPSALATGVIAVYGVVVVLAGSGQIHAAATRNEPPVLLARLAELAAPLRTINTYGAFAEIITERQEIVVEGSLDGQTWREYTFKYKPDDVAGAPGFNVPHQPRLDWQMWFAALGNESRNWFPDFLQRLLAASSDTERDVLALLANDPFAGAKPKAVRAVIYEYRFASPEQRALGLWWERRQTGLYYPAMTAQPAGQNAPAGSTLIDSIVRPR
ncbi:MAG: lipase maturation factor family protein [Burkholderiales bacterium]|nr:lipase maturation factor family protein [Burkholderiales bacterium]